MRVMICNMRTSIADDGLDNWSRRRDFCLDVIRAQSVDLLGFQEVQRDQYDDLSTGLPQYAAWGMGRTPHGESDKCRHVPHSALRPAVSGRFLDVGDAPT